MAIDPHVPSFRTRSYGKLYVARRTYRKDNSVAVELVRKDGEPFAVLSASMPDAGHLLGEDEFFAKTWSENEEIAADALRSGIFRDTGRASGGIVNASIWAFM